VSLGCGRTPGRAPASTRCRCASGSLASCA